jgi:hypothetical protein
MTHSAPTPARGLETELARIDDGRELKHYRGADVKGKIVFTREHGAHVARVAAKLGAIGVLSDFIVTRDTVPGLPPMVLGTLVDDPVDFAQHLQWMHLGSGHRDGMFGFALSPASGQGLRAQMRSRRIRVRAMVDSEFSVGTLPAVTGVIPGTRPGGEQILLLSHLFEPGASDNASGCAAALETVSALLRLIKRGVLPRPKRTIRVLQMLEVQGTMCYLHHHQEQIPRTLAALCLDSVGGDEPLTRVPLMVYRNPASHPSFTDPLIEWIAREWLDRSDGAFHWRTEPYWDGSDNVIATDPLGIPCPWIGGTGRLWHTTADTMETIDRRALVHASVLSGAYTHFLAAAGAPESKLALSLSETYGQRSLLDLIDRLRGNPRESAVDGVQELRDEAVRSVARLGSVLTMSDGRGRPALKRRVDAAQARMRRFARTQERLLSGALRD